MKAQDLKNSILQLAIQGKLVSQDPNDESAEVLYAKIQAEKQKLIKEGKIKKDKPSSPITDDKVPFEIPQSWKWVRLGELCFLDNGKETIGEKLPLLDAKYLRGKKEPDILEKGVKICKGEYLILVDGENSGEVFCSSEMGYMGSTFRKLQFFDINYVEYILKILRFYQKMFRENKKGGAIPHLDKNLFKNLPISIPPLAEQKRIVAKIEELEPLVKQYDKAETELSVLNDSFPEQLKKSILQYAIQGKLVTQDANDESAEVLYTKIQAEKQKLIKEGKIKKDKPLPPITDDEVPFEIPSTWKWVRLKDICSQITDGEHTTPKRVVKSAVPLLTAKNIRSGFITYDNVDYVDENTAKKCWERCNPQIGDILMTCVGYIGRMSILKEQKSFVIVRSVALIRSIEVYVEYLKYALEAPYTQSQMATETKQTAQPCLYLNKINEIIVPLQPLTEQHRIVAKVTELMQYCEKLKI